MKALSIRQPWAWLILHAGKDIENRSRHWNFRGKLYIHAAKGMTRDEYLAAEIFIAGIQHAGKPVTLPPFEDLQRGGLVGTVEVADCIDSSDSPWFNGPFGLVLKNPEPIPFVPFKGALGLFDADLPAGTRITFTRDIIDSPGDPDDECVWAIAGDTGAIHRIGGPLGHWAVCYGRSTAPFEAALGTDFQLHGQ